MSMVEAELTLAPAPAAARLGRTLLLGAGIVLMVCAPVIRGGNRHVALIGLEWLGLAVLLGAWLMALSGQAGQGAWGQGRVRAGLLVLAASPLWVALLQLLPLPVDVWAALPGRAFYHELLAVVQMPTPEWRVASLTPAATWASVLAGIPLVACFVLALSCSADQLRLLARIWIGLALAQALMGLAQLGPFDVLYFDAKKQGVVGTFANRNHFANFLAMTLPLVLLEIRRALHDATAHHQRVGHAGLLWGVALFVLLAAVLASSSRTGIATALLVMLATTLLLPGRRGAKVGLRWRMWALAALLLVAVASVGLGWLERFQGELLAGDASFRGLMRASTWVGAMEFWPLGSGLGSYGMVYPRFQPAVVTGFVEYAHSDYVQFLMECGALFVVLAALLLWLLVRQAGWLARSAMRGHGQTPHEQLMMIFGLGLLALLLHSWLDFNLHIPANAMLGVFLLGGFLRSEAR
jgi:O-Antigen ligase